MPNSPIKTMQDLKGKNVGTNLVGSSPYLYLQAGLKQAGMTINDVQIVSAPGTNVTYQQLVAGNVEAAVLSAPTDAQAQQAGACRGGAEYADRRRRMQTAGVLIEINAE